MIDIELISVALRLAAPLLFAALGGVICERAGVVNIGLEGLMLFGAISANVAAVHSGSLAVGVLAGIGAGLLFGWLFGVFTVSLKADQLVFGIAFNIFAVGLSAFVREEAFGLRAGLNAGRTQPFPLLNGPTLSELPVLGRLLAQQTVFGLLAFALPFVAAWVLYRTRAGLHLRMVGENARAADALGINVDRTRLLAVIIGSACAALGGACLTLVDVHYFISNMTEGRGYMALAAVILARWDPLRALLICVVIGAAEAFQFRIQAMGWPIVPQLVMMFPYLVVLILIVTLQRGATGPADNGRPFVRS